jgi:hypothetical protein
MGAGGETDATEGFAEATVAASRTPVLRESVNAVPRAPSGVTIAAKVGKATFNLGRVAAPGEARRGSGRDAPSAAVNCRVRTHDKAGLNR